MHVGGGMSGEEVVLVGVLKLSLIELCRVAWPKVMKKGKKDRSFDARGWWRLLKRCIFPC